MAKKKRQPKKPDKPAPPGREKQGFTPSGLGPVEKLLRGLSSRRGRARRSPLAIAQEIADAAWEAARPQDQVALAQHALSVSADCADAYIILANQAPSRQEARELLEEGTAAGARAIGKETFEAAAGHFWLDQRTRPYMRARLGLAQCLWESGQRSEAAEHYADMLRLNPTDNQGVRYLLLGALVELDRDADAVRLVERYQDDSSAEWAYTSALLAFRRDGDSPAARELLHDAVATNQYVPEYLLGNRHMPTMPPTYVSRGGEDEAVSYAGQFLRTWRGSPGAIPWLRKTLRIPLPQPPKTRKPAWSRFRHTFLRLPQVEGEIWQLDVCRLPEVDGPGDLFNQEPSATAAEDLFNQEPPATAAESELSLGDDADSRSTGMGPGDLQAASGDEQFSADSSSAARRARAKSRAPWALVLWNRTDDAILAFEAGDIQPTTAEAWDALIEAILRPRPAGGFPAEPHRPAEVHVRRRAFLKAWQDKLRQVNICCRLFDELDGLDRVLENLLPAAAAGDRPPTGADAAAELDNMAALPQEFGEVWQADVRHLPGWLEHEGELRRPWASLVASRDERAVLAQNLSVEPPSHDWIWSSLADAMLRPMMGSPHRPGVIELTDESLQQAFQEQLDSLGIRCVLADELEQVDDIFQQLGKFLSGGRAARPLVEVPGVRPDDMRCFYAAAAEFYRAAPWRLVPGDTTLKVESDKYQTRTWYAVVMGQSGLVLGLALYEDLNMLRRLFSSQDDERMSRQTTGLSVMFGEAFEVPIADLDAAQRNGWEVAGEEAYPNPIHVNPGRSMRPPLLWELELLEACLRAIPRFLDNGRSSVEYDLPCARGLVTLRISQM